MWSPCLSPAHRKPAPSRCLIPRRARPDRASSLSSPSPPHPSLAMVLLPVFCSPLPSALASGRHCPSFPWRHFLLPGGRRPP
uniref:Uncharacterized protein n=1 Tax=Zea mays TaxID=4577 RepID=B4FEH7_MAIZE|nr:unknown [Zea mays]